MPSFGQRSRDRLDTCDSRLQLICKLVIEHYDFTVLCGARSELEQNEAYATGASTLKWPRSKHNARIQTVEDGSVKMCSEAVDIAPWHKQKPHIRWGNEREFVFLAGRIMQAADELQLPIRWGGNWDMDDDLYDPNRPFDLVHFELR